MSGNIPPIQQFCQDPSKYANKFPQHTLDYWQQFCDSQKGQQQEDIGTEIANIAKGIPGDIANMIEGLFQPQSLKILSAFIGINLGPKLLRTMIAKGIAWKLPEEVTSQAIKLAAGGVSEAALNTAAVTDAIISAAIREGTDEVVAYSFAWIARGLELFSSLVDPLMDALMIIQLYSMIFDAFDPCHLNEYLDANQLSLYNSTFDQVFRENIVVALDTISDGYGNVIFTNNWPITFYASGGIIEKVAEDKYAPMRMEYMARYLNAMTWNANGERICWPQGGELVQSTSLQKAIRSLAMLLANDNTVVAKGIEKYIPIVLAIFVGAILLLLIKYLIK